MNSAPSESVPKSGLPEGLRSSKFTDRCEVGPQGLLARGRRTPVGRIAVIQGYREHDA